jgi:hypothetical protein
MEKRRRVIELSQEKLVILTFSIYAYYPEIWKFQPELFNHIWDVAHEAIIENENRERNPL